MYKSKANEGLVSNWNNCIQHASGEWIKFVFQDDYLENDCVERFIEYASKTSGKTHLLLSKRKYFFDKPVSDEQRQYYMVNLVSLDKIGNINKDGYISAKYICNFAVSRMSVNFIGEPTVMMFRKSMVEELGYFNHALDQICDLEFALRIASVYGLVYVPHEITNFRIHEQSTTRKNIESRYYELSCLEPVKFAHQLLFDNSYTKFRKDISLYNSIKLKIYYYVRGFESKLKAKNSTRNMTAFNETSEQFPMMSKLMAIPLY